ncbi:hypothetical protein AB0B45_32365 [Nonomuraea sp. NPDC049152]|uniref:hypothetical protein n=1 Tax=Nonomuraea sp. NPDC049152 TaxID=3154350 RepID=UPI0033D18E42
MKILTLMRAHAGAAAVLSVLTLSACLLLSGMPRALQLAYDRGLRQTLAATTAQDRDLRVLAQNATPIRRRAELAARDQTFRALLPPELAAIATSGGTSHFSVRTVDTPAFDRPKQYVNVAWLSDFDRRLTWVEGGEPGPPGSFDAGRLGTIPLLEVGVPESATTAMKLRIGSTVVIGQSQQIAVRVSGVYRPRNPADPYWDHERDTITVDKRLPPGQLEPDLYVTTLTSDKGLELIDYGARRTVYSWVLGVDPGKAVAIDLPSVLRSLKDYSGAVALEADEYAANSVATGLPRLLTGYAGSLSTAQTTMFLVLGGLLAVALGVIVLAVQLMAERMDAALALTRARGGSLGQVVGAGTAVVAVAAVPAAVAGYLLSWLVPGPVTPIAHMGPLIVLATAAGFAATRLAITHRAPLHERRDDVAAARPSPRRITLELTTVVLALVGAYLVRSRGVSTQAAAQGADPFLLLVPVALAVAASLITLRCYPFPLRAFVRLAARRRPAVPFLGLTMAARSKSFTVLPVLILLPALAVSVFASIVSGGVSSTQELAAWQKVGADIRVEHPVAITAEAVARVRRVPGVEGVLTAMTGDAVVGRTPIKVVSIDLDAYRDLVAGGPLEVPARPGGPGTPALASPLLGREPLSVRWQVAMRVNPRGSVTGFPGLETQRNLVVLPADANERAGAPTRPNVLLVKGSADPAAVLRAASTQGGLPPVVKSRAQALAAIKGSPLTGTVLATLTIVTAALAAYSLVAVVLTLVITGPARAGALSFLRTLGLSPRQARRLTVLEISPMILITALAGLALGLGLPAALGPGMDLSSYAGGLAVTDYGSISNVELLTPILLSAGLAAVSVLGAYAHTAIGRRRGLGSVLRVGDQ